MSLSSVRGAGEAAARRFSVITEHVAAIPSALRKSSYGTEVRRLIFLDDHIIYCSCFFFGHYSRIVRQFHGNLGFQAHPEAKEAAKKDPWPQMGSNVHEGGDSMAETVKEAGYERAREDADKIYEVMSARTYRLRRRVNLGLSGEFSHPS